MENARFMEFKSSGFLSKIPKESCSFVEQIARGIPRMQTGTMFLTLLFI